MDGDGELAAKRAKPSSSGGGEDRLSVLPDDALHLILLRLPSAGGGFASPTPTDPARVSAASASCAATPPPMPQPPGSASPQAASSEGSSSTTRRRWRMASGVRMRMR